MTIHTYITYIHTYIDCIHTYLHTYIHYIHKYIHTHIRYFTLYTFRCYCYSYRCCCYCCFCTEHRDHMVFPYIFSNPTPDIHHFSFRICTEHHDLLLFLCFVHHHLPPALLFLSLFVPCIADTLIFFTFSQHAPTTVFHKLLLTLNETEGYRLNAKR